MSNESDWVSEPVSSDEWESTPVRPHDKRAAVQAQMRANPPKGRNVIPPTKIDVVDSKADTEGNAAALIEAANAAKQPAEVRVPTPVASTVPATTQPLKPGVPDPSKDPHEYAQWLNQRIAERDAQPSSYKPSQYTPGETYGATAVNAALFGRMPQWSASDAAEGLPEDARKAAYKAALLRQRGELQQATSTNPKSGVVGTMAGMSPVAAASRGNPAVMAADLGITGANSAETMSAGEPNFLETLGAGGRGAAMGYVGARFPVATSAAFTGLGAAGQFGARVPYLQEDQPSADANMFGGALGLGMVGGAKYARHLQNTGKVARAEAAQANFTDFLKSTEEAKLEADLQRKISSLTSKYETDLAKDSAAKAPTELQKAVDALAKLEAKRVPMAGNETQNFRKYLANLRGRVNISKLTPQSASMLKSNPDILAEQLNEYIETGATTEPEHVQARVAKKLDPLLSEQAGEIARIQQRLTEPPPAPRMPPEISPEAQSQLREAALLRQKNAGLQLYPEAVARKAAAEVEQGAAAARRIRATETLPELLVRRGRDVASVVRGPKEALLGGGNTPEEVATARSEMLRRAIEAKLASERAPVDAAVSKAASVAGPRLSRGPVVTAAGTGANADNRSATLLEQYLRSLGVK